MFRKNIEFKVIQAYIEAGLDLPVPAKKNIPQWYKDLDHKLNKKTVKGCMPFLDALTAGYIIKTPFDLAVVHNKKNPHNPEIAHNNFSSVHEASDSVRELNIPFNHTNEFHQPFQMEGSPLVDKNLGMGFHKFVSPWIIKTPPGYSCLFISPMNNKDDRFDIISGIVDTDTFDMPINFPFVINGDKYKSIETLIEKGTAMVQVIPFKRDTWQMKVKTYKNVDLHKSILKLFSKFFNKYKTMYWSKKSWR